MEERRKKDLNESDEPTVEKPKTETPPANFVARRIEQLEPKSTKPSTEIPDPI